MIQLTTPLLKIKNKKIKNRKFRHDLWTNLFCVRFLKNGIQYNNNDYNINNDKDIAVYNDNSN